MLPHQVAAPAERSIYRIEGDNITIMFDPARRPGGFDRKKCYTYEGRRVIKAAVQDPQSKKALGQGADDPEPAAAPKSESKEESESEQGERPE